MRRCLKIRVTGKVQGVAYRAFAQKSAHDLGLEGTIQNEENGNITIYTCGPSEKLDKFIDALYQGTPAAQITDVLTEPFVNEKNFRGVFRIIGD
jgi:acylphosphatase